MILKNRQLIVLFICMAAIRISIPFFVDNTRPLKKDAALYYNISSHLLFDNKFAAEIGNDSFGNPIKDNVYAIKEEVTAQVPPGYPVFLMLARLLLGDNLKGIKILQILFELCAYLLFLLVIYKFVNNRIIRIYIILLIIYLPFIKYSILILTETLFLSLILVSFSLLLYFIRSRNSIIFFIYGIFSGMTCLIRPTPLPLFLLMLLILANDLYNKNSIALKSHIFKCSLAVIGMLIVISPWIIRNVIVYNKLIPSSTLGGLSLFFTTSERIGGMTGSFSPKVRETKKLQDYFNNNEIDVKKESLNEAELDHYFKRIGIEQLKRNPKNYLKNISINFFRFWFNLPFKGASVGSYMLAVFHLFLIIIIMNNIKILVKNRFTLLFFIPIFYFSMVHTFIGNTSARYNLPIMPLVLFLAAYSLDLIVLRFREWFVNNNKYFENY